MGFKLGMPKFVSGEKDWVYGVIVNGKSVVAGDKISVEDSVYIQVGNGLRDIDENDLMGGDDFEEVDAPRSSTTEKKEKETSVEKKETSTEKKSETKTEAKQESKSDSKSTTSDSKSSKP